MPRYMIVMVVVAVDTPSASNNGSLITFVRVAGLTFFNGRYENVSGTDTLASSHSCAILSGGCEMAVEATSLCMSVMRKFGVSEPFVRYIRRPDAPVDKSIILNCGLVAIEGVT